MTLTDKNESGKLPLSDEELNGVAGGSQATAIVAWRKLAEAEGRTVQVGCSHSGAIGLGKADWLNAKCPKCGDVNQSLFCDYQRKHPQKYLLGGESSGKQNESINTKCYHCGYLFGTCDVSSNSWGIYIENWGR